jgi:hypothetical protein
MRSDDTTDCAVCQQFLCEPVTLTACGHHFCRNCVTKIERYKPESTFNQFGALQSEPECRLKCPLCRHPHRTPVAWLPLNEALDAHVKILDDEYAARREQAEGERRSWREEEEDNREGGSFVVSGCSVPEVCGVYSAARLNSYLGPTPYVNKHGYGLFRWARRFWVIAAVTSVDEMEDQSKWLWVAPTTSNVLAPAKTGWQPGAACRGSQGLEVPEVRRHRADTESAGHSTHRPRSPGRTARCAGAGCAIM